MAISRDEPISHTFSDVKVLRSAVGRIGDLLKKELPETFGRNAEVSAGQNTAVDPHVRNAWEELEADGMTAEKGTIFVAVGPGEGGYAVHVFLTFSIATLALSGDVKGFDRSTVEKVATGVRELLI